MKLIFFVFFVFYPSALECGSMRFLNTLRWKLHFPQIPKDSYSSVFDEKCEKIARRVWGRKLYASYRMAMVIRDCCPEVRRNLSMRGYLYPCANYIFHPFVVCVRVGGARSGWWYALRRSTRDEPGEPIKIQTNPTSFFVLGFGGLRSWAIALESSCI